MSADGGAVGIPTIDLEPYFAGNERDKRRVAAEVDAACIDSGFLIVVGHSIEERLIDETRRLAKDFYRLPVNEKLRLRMEPGIFRGYTSPGDLSVAASYGVEGPPDLKETFAIGPVDPPSDPDYRHGGGAFFAANRWPTRPARMREVWPEYYRAMEVLARDLMRIFALALGLDELWFDGKIDRHISPMSAQYYPPVSGRALDGQLRAGPHTDFGSLTILQRDASSGGLEVAVGEEWVAAPNVAGSLTVNLGDLMSDWTNGRWRSTLHRVVLPSDAFDESDRLAIAFFHQPNYDAVVETIPTCETKDGVSVLERTTSGAHFARKLAAMRGE